jgi:hypothetical protein
LGIPRKDGCYLGRGYLLAPSTLDLTCLWNSCCLRLNWLSSLSVLDVTDCQIQVLLSCRTHIILDLDDSQVQGSWVWHVCQTHFTSFFLACQGRMIISLDVTREDVHPNGPAKSLHTVKLCVSRAWHNIWVWLAPNSACRGLAHCQAPTQSMLIFLDVHRGGGS